MERREFLKLSGAGLAVTGLTTYSGSVAALVDHIAEIKPSNLFDLAAHQPPVIKSRNGVLSLELVCEYSNGAFKINGLPLNLRSYNKKLPAYTLEAHPGDVLKIHLVNNLPASSSDHDHPADMNVPHGFNNTNLHTHGLNVSPQGQEDNVLIEIHPGETFQYITHIPEDHPCGTFWYHPHKHGSSMRQLASGMSGFLIIKNRDQDLSKTAGDLSRLPELHSAKTVNIAFHELVLDANGEVPNSLNPVDDLFQLDDTYQPKARLFYTVNGLAVNEGADPNTGVPGVAPFLKMRPGEVQIWRFGMLCHLQDYRFALEGHQLHIAAWDGITAENLSTQNELIIGPGSRVDILVKASDTPGVYAFNMLQEQFGEFPLFVTPYYGTPTLPAFNVIVEGQPLPMNLPARLNPPMERLPYIEDHEITRRREIEFKVTGDVLLNLTTGVYKGDTRQFYINNLKFSANRINHTVLLDTAEEWTITNIHEAANHALQINHPFHIHTNWILVLAVYSPDGNGGFTEELYNNGRGIWMDNIDVPHGGKAVIRTRFQKFPGIFPLHCHVLAHEDEGMMHLVEVVDPTPVEFVVGPAGGELVSTDQTKRVTVAFGPGSFKHNTEVVYQYILDIPKPAAKGLIGLERYFHLNSKHPLKTNESAIITINFPLELAKGEKYRPATVKLYRLTDTGWTTSGIHHVSLDQKNGVLVSSVKDNLTGYYAVIATELSGPVTNAINEPVKTRHHHS